MCKSKKTNIYFIPLIYLSGIFYLQCSTVCRLPLSPVMRKDIFHNPDHGLLECFNGEVQEIRKYHKETSILLIYGVLAMS